MKRTIILAAALQASIAGAAFKCVDEKGITHFGDTPPAACSAVVMFEVTPSGNILRRIDPTPTADQLKTIREENDRKREVERIASEQKRKDVALVSTYASEREFDVARERNLEPLRSRISIAQDRLKVIDARQLKIAEEMEFYKAGKSKKGTGDTPPVMLVQERDRLAHEKQQLVGSLAASENEASALKARFDADKQRWVEIKTGVTPKPTQDAKGPTTVTLTAGAAGKARCGQKVYECPAGETYVCTEGNAWGQRRAYTVNCVVERN